MGTVVQSLELGNAEKVMTPLPVVPTEMAAPAVVASNIKAPASVAIRIWLLRHWTADFNRVLKFFI
jgi:hypothetical protein